MAGYRNKALAGIIITLAFGLTLASGADAQQGYFAGEFVGVENASGASISLLQQGGYAAGRFVKNGVAYRIEARVSGTTGTGVIMDHSGTGHRFGLRLVNGGLVVMVESPHGVEVLPFQRGGAGARPNPGNGGGDIDDRKMELCEKTGFCL